MRSVSVPKVFTVYMPKVTVLPSGHAQCGLVPKAFSIGTKPFKRGELTMPRQRQKQICCASICLREIQPWESAVEIRCFARTHGMGKRRTSKSEQMFLCPQCAQRTVSGKEPSRAAPFDVAIFRILLDLVGADPDVTQASWKQIAERRQEILYPRALPEGEVLPPLKTLKAAV